MMDIKPHLVFAVVLLSCSPSFGQSPADIKEFNREYSEYRKQAEAGNWMVSLVHARRAYELGKEVYADNKTTNAILTYNYGHNLLQLRDPDQAEAILLEALDLYESGYGKDAVELIPILKDIGEAKASKLNSFNITYHVRALRLAGEHYGENSSEYGQLAVDIGVTILLEAKSEDAERFLRDGYRILSRLYGDKDPRVAYAAFSLGKFNLSLKKYNNAIDLFNQTLAASGDPDKPAGTLELTTHGFLVYAYESLKQSGKATEHALAIGRMTPEHSDQEMQPLFRVEPELTRAVRRVTGEGHVVLSADIDKEGYVKNINALEYVGAEAFIESAIKAVEQWRYAPRFNNGEPVVVKNIKIDLGYKIIY